MKSKLPASAFKKKLKKSIATNESHWIHMSPFWLLALFNSDRKEFFGIFDNKHFEISLYPRIGFPFYKIIGTYNVIEGDQIELHYNLRLNKFMLLTSTILQFLFNLLFTLIASLEGWLLMAITFLFFNVICIIIPIVILRYRKNLLKEKFERVFQVID